MPREESVCFSMQKPSNSVYQPGVRQMFMHHKKRVSAVCEHDLPKSHIMYLASGRINGSKKDL